MNQHLTFPRLQLALPRHALAGFASLLQHGILLPVERPVTITPLLLSLPGFTREYLETKVQTIFIDGVAADSLDHSLNPGTTLALSAAMPGLAGAIFRRQGLHGSLRTRPEGHAGAGHAAAGFVTLKLFNAIAADRVGDLLSQGILIRGKAFHDFVARRPDVLQPPVAMTLDDQKVDVPDMLHRVAEYPVLAVLACPLPE
jgi:hypothetical protein